MKVSIIIVFSILFISCNISKDKPENGNKLESQRTIKHYFDEEDRSYVVGTYLNDSLPIDTFRYYRDSMETQLGSMTTIVYKGSNALLNTIRNYKINGKLDSSRSIFYNIEKSNDKLKISYHSLHNDSVYIIIGDLDTNYNIRSFADTFHLQSNSIVIPFNKSYTRARLGLFEKIDSNYTGRELYIPKYQVQQRRAIR